jgi:hypothetical protein
MCRLRTCAAAVAGLFVVFAMSACSMVEMGSQPAAPEFPPPPPHAQREEPPQSAAPPAPEQARAEIYRWFMKAGYKDFQAEALMEHAQVESGYRACAAGPGGYRYLYQWSSTRLEHLRDFAHTSGCPQLHTQLAFADRELRNDPKYSCFWEATTESGAYAALRRGFGRGSC